MISDMTISDCACIWPVEFPIMFFFSFAIPYLYYFTETHFQTPSMPHISDFLHHALMPISVSFNLIIVCVSQDR